MKQLRVLLTVIWVSGVGIRAMYASEPVVNKVDTPDVVLHEVTDRILPHGALNVVTFAAPRTLKVSELGLREAGFRGGPTFRAADEIRIFASREQMNASPKARLWLNTRENAWWFHTGGEGSAEAYELQTGEVLVLVTRASTEAIAWVNPLR